MTDETNERNSLRPHPALTVFHVPPLYLGVISGLRLGEFVGQRYGPASAVAAFLGAAVVVFLFAMYICFCLAFSLRGHVGPRIRHSVYCFLLSQVSDGSCLDEGLHEEVDQLYGPGV
jgi:hypothetical protein